MIWLFKKFSNQQLETKQCTYTSEKKICSEIPCVQNYPDCPKYIEVKELYDWKESDINIDTCIPVQCIIIMLQGDSQSLDK